MLSWYETYYIKNTVYDNINLNNYLSQLSKNSSSEKNIENKINQIEVEYQNKLNEIIELCNNKVLIEEIKKKSSLDIIQKELDIIKLLTKYCLQNKKIEYKLFMNCLNLILDFSEILRERLEQKKITTSTVDNPSDKISRCSYKFCSYQDNCVYNYNLKIKKLCYQDHYVHNMVSSDIINIINHINSKYEDTKFILHNKEILKTINTLSFVISHMEHELKTKCLYLPETEWENNHVVKNKN
jgi:hypothetical protein